MAQPTCVKCGNTTFEISCGDSRSANVSLVHCARCGAVAGVMDSTGAHAAVPAPAPVRLNENERLALTWSLAWPCLLLALPYSLIRARLQLPQAQLTAIDLLFSIFQFFFFTTWVVRRTVELDFSQFHLVVMRDCAAATRIMDYRESLGVAWLISWRTAFISMPLYLLGDLLLGQDAFDKFVWSVPGWLMQAAVELAIFYIWIVKSAVRKHYAGFRVGLEHPALCPPAGTPLSVT